MATSRASRIGISTRLRRRSCRCSPKTSGNAIAAAQAALAGFAPRFDEAFTAGLRRKLGLLTPQPTDFVLAQDLLDRMAANSADFTLTFRRLCNAAEGAEHDDRVHALFADPAAFDEWAGRWRKRMSEEGGNPVNRAATMRRANPASSPAIIWSRKRSRRLRSMMTTGHLKRFSQCLQLPTRTNPASRATQNRPAPIRSCIRPSAAPDVRVLLH